MKITKNSRVWIDNVNQALQLNLLLQLQRITPLIRGAIKRKGGQYWLYICKDECMCSFTPLLSNQTDDDFEVIPSADELIKSLQDEIMRVRATVLQAETLKDLLNAGGKFIYWYTDKREIDVGWLYLYQPTQIDIKTLASYHVDNGYHALENADELIEKLKGIQD